MDASIFAPPIRIFLLFPAANESLGIADKYWFQWQWQDNVRIQVIDLKDDEDCDKEIERIRRWQKSGFTPCVVWQEQSDDFLPKMTTAKIEAVELYWVAEDRSTLVELLCNPDPELEAVWERLCTEPVESTQLGGPQDDGFWQVYGEKFNEWLRCLPDSEREDLTPKRSFAVEEFRKLDGDPPTFALRTFPAARLGLTHDGILVPQGAFLSLPQPAGIKQGVSENFNQAWWRALHTPGPHGDRRPLMQIRRPLGVLPHIRGTETYASAPLHPTTRSSRSRGEFPFKNDTIECGLVYDWGSGALTLIFESAHPELAGTKYQILVREVLDPRSPTILTSGEIELQPSESQPEVLIAHWETTLIVNSEWAEFNITESTTGELLLDFIL